MNTWDGMDIGYWSTVALLFTATFCLLLYLSGFWIAVLLLGVFCLPLSYAFLPLAAIGGWVGGGIGWLICRVSRSASCSTP